MDDIRLCLMICNFEYVQLENMYSKKASQQPHRFLPANALLKKIPFCMVRALEAVRRWCDLVSKAPGPHNAIAISGNGQLLILLRKLFSTNTIYFLVVFMP